MKQALSGATLTACSKLRILRLTWFPIIPASIFGSIISMADIASNRPNLQEHEHYVYWMNAMNVELHVKNLNKYSYSLSWSNSPSLSSAKRNTFDQQIQFLYSISLQDLSTHDPNKTWLMGPELSKNPVPNNTNVFRWRSAGAESWCGRAHMEKELNFRTLSDHKWQN